jgi:hypothetical protein
MNKLCSLVILLLLFSCNGKKAESNSKVLNKENKELSIEFSLKTNVEDIFRITLTDIYVDEFQNKNISAFEKIPATSNFESMKAKFEEGNFSKNIVIKLGDKNEKEIDLEHIRFSYNKKVIEIDSKNFDTYMAFNKYIKRDSVELNKFYISKIGNTNFNPVIYAKQNLISELLK